MSAGISRVNGQAAAGVFIQPTLIGLRIAATGKFTANSGGGTSAITEGGYEKAVKIVQTFGSIVWLADRTDSDYFFAVVDGNTVNKGSDGAYSSLKSAFAAALGGTSGTYTVAEYTTITNQGAFAA